MRLRTKFNLVLLAVFIVGLSASGYISFTLLQKQAREFVLQKAGVMMGAASAIRGYTVSQVRPFLSAQMQTKFRPQTVPAYAATETFNNLRETYPEYTYKEATLNPTNPRDRAAEWEVDIIEQFANHPDNKEIVGIRRIATGSEALFMARPIRITNEACLTCHSTPERAPATMIQLYGKNNGFNWQLNQVVGAQIVSVPMSLAQKSARETFLTFMGSLFIVFFVVFIALNIMLSKIVVKPITQMSRLADQMSGGEMDLPELDEKGKDEISVLASSFNRMKRSLEQAIKILEE